jgi:lipopolysaccharide export system protein LptC
VTTARAETSEQRLSVYRGLVARNRVVALLRVALPVLGLAAFGYFAIHILIAGLNGFSIGKIRFSGGSVIVDAPSYSGIMANGNVYKVGAQAADASVTNLDVINLKNATLLLKKPSGSTMRATAAAGAFNTITQVMRVPGGAVISDSAGDRGTLDNLVVNLPRQTLKALGRVRITMADGTTIDGIGLDYDAKTSVWTFGHSTVTLPGTPGNKPDAPGNSDTEDPAP